MSTFNIPSADLWVACWRTKGSWEKMSEKAQSYYKLIVRKWTPSLSGLEWYWYWNGFPPLSANFVPSCRKERRRKVYAHLRLYRFPQDRESWRQGRPSHQRERGEDSSYFSLAGNVSGVVFGLLGGIILAGNSGCPLPRLALYLFIHLISSTSLENNKTFSSLFYCALGQSIHTVYVQTHLTFCLTSSATYVNRKNWIESHLLPPAEQSTKSVNLPPAKSHQNPPPLNLL